MTIAQFRKRQKESRAFKKITAKRNLQVRRKAFADESLVQAKKEGKRLAVTKATKGNFGSKLRKAVSKGGKVLLKRALTPPKKAPTRIRTVKRKAPVRRVQVRRTTIERTPATPAGFEGFL